MKSKEEEELNMEPDGADASWDPLGFGRRDGAPNLTSQALRRRRGSTTGAVELFGFSIKAITFSPLHLLLHGRLHPVNCISAFYRQMKEINKGNRVSLYTWV
ncbi:hypothetical protein Dimus_025394 [Dionaea muscipula]